MNKTLEVVDAIKNGDERRIEFFLKKLSTDLKQYDLNIELYELRDMFLDSVNNFDSNQSKAFYYTILKEIKDNLRKKYSIEVIGNKLFNDAEMVILNYYLKDINGAYYSSEDIAKKLGIPIINVIKASDRLKTLYKRNKYEIENIFNNTDRLYLEVIKKQDVPKIKIIPTITEEELEYLGLYTGQINDICLDIKEIAEKFNVTETNVNFKLRKIFELLKSKKNLNIVLERYPSIMPFLKIKSKSLELEFQDDKPKKKRKTSRSKIENAVKFLKYFYQRDENGYYRTIEELAKLFDIKEGSVSATKYNILKLFNEDIVFKTQILALYPNFEYDLEIYENWKKNKNQYDKYEEMSSEYAYLFKLIYKKDENGKYSTIKSIADKLGVDEVLLYRRNRDLLNILDRNPILRELLLQKYPTLLIDKRDYDVKVTAREKRSEHSIESRDFRIENYVEFLKLFYKRNNEGHYNNRKEIANKLFMSVEYVYTKHRLILDAFDNDEDIRKEILIRYPEFIDDRTNYKLSKSLYKNKELRSTIKTRKKALEYSEFLKNIYSKKEDGRYYQVRELEDILDIDRTYICSKRRNILNAIDNNEQLKSFVIDAYPTFIQDRLDYEACESTKSKKSKKGIVKAREDKLSIEIAKYAMSKDENGNYRTAKDVCKKFGIREATILKKINYIADGLNNNDQNIINLVRFEYPEFLENKIEYDKLEQIETIVEDKFSFDIDRANNYIKFLRLLFNTKDDGTYHSNNEIARVFNIKSNGINVKKHQIFSAMGKDENLKNYIYKMYPELDTDINERKIYLENSRIRTDSSSLSKIEMIVSEELYKDVTREVLTSPALASKLHIKETSLSTIKSAALKKIKSNEELQKQYPTAESEKIIRKVSFKNNSVSVDEAEIYDIKDHVRAYDIPNNDIGNTKDNLLTGIKNLNNSIYKDYVELCTYEQKAILALRLGFFNNTIYGSKDIAELFNIKEDEVKLLTEQCLDFSYRKNIDKEKIKELKLN